MWLWLQNNNKFNINKFFKKVILFSLLAHLVLLIILLFGVRDKSLNLDIFLNKELLNNPPVPIVLLPFAKNVPGSIEQLKRLSKKSGRSKKSVNVKKTIVKKEANKKIVAKKAIVIDKTQKKNNKKEALKKEVKKEIKKSEPVKQEPVKVEPEVIKQEAEPLPEIKPEEVINLDEPVAIYLGAKDMEGFKLISNIQGEILKYWKPPMGLPRGIECKVNIKVDKDGKVENLKIEKASKILAYDISLRNAILKSIMPNEIRGKEFSLTLNS